MSLQLSQDNINLGTVVAKSSKTFSINLKNTSPEPIQIVNLRPSCGSCTSATVATAKIGANGSIPMTVIFTPSSTSFSTTKTVTITYREGNVDKSIVFTFTGKVV